MSPKKDRVTYDISPESSVSSDDPAGQQLLVEAHTPRPKPLPSFNSAVLKSASLLNAARVNKLPATDLPATISSLSLQGSRAVDIQSSRGGIASRNVNGKLKLKRPTFLAEDLGKRRKADTRKRRDIYALPQSPEKDDAEVILPLATNKQRIKVLKKDKKLKAKVSSELPSEFHKLELSAINPDPPKPTPELAPPELTSDAQVLHEQDAELKPVPDSSILLGEELSPVGNLSSSPPIISTQIHPPVVIESLLPSGHPRCTGINASKTSEFQRAQCRRRGAFETESGWRCAPHANNNDRTIEEAPDAPAAEAPAETPLSPQAFPSQARSPPPIEALLPNGNQRCTATVLTNSKGTLRQQCRRKAQTETDRGWQCTSHIKAHSSTDVAVPNDRAESNNEVEDGESERRKSGRLAGEEPDIDDVDWEKIPGFHAHSTPKKFPKRKADTSQLKPIKAPKSPRIQKAKPVEAGEASTVPKCKPGRLPVTKRVPDVRVPSRNIVTRVRSTQDEKGLKKPAPAVQDENQPMEFVDAQVGEEVPTAIGHQEELNAGKLGTKPTSEGKKRENEANKTAGPPPDTASPSHSDKQPASVPVLKFVTVNPEKSRTGSKVAEDAVYDVEDDDVEDEISDPPEREADDGMTDLDRVFRFIDCEERDGGCQTEEAVEIHAACEQACNLIVKHQLSVQEISDTLKFIRAMLTTKRNSKVKDQKAFKTDTYAYLFRSLTFLLETVFDWGDENAKMMGPIPAMQIFVSLARDIISLKDTLDSWKITVPQRYKGDRLIQEVGNKLILPLRKVYSSYLAQLNILEEEEKIRKKRDELYARRREKAREEERKNKESEKAKERQKYWQYLEVERSACEPTRERRLKLAGEFDANGERFDRITVFPTRKTLPPSKRWTDEEEVALAEALEKFAGPTPHKVLVNIFQACCRPGGVLRDFTVTDIVAKAAKKKEEYTQLFEENQWEVPRWIRQIPVLV